MENIGCSSTSTLYNVPFHFWILILLVRFLFSAIVCADLQLEHWWEYTFSFRFHEREPESIDCLWFIISFTSWCIFPLYRSVCIADFLYIFRARLLKLCCSSIHLCAFSFAVVSQCCDGVQKIPFDLIWSIQCRRFSSSFIFDDYILHNVTNCTWFNQKSWVIGVFH